MTRANATSRGFTALEAAAGIALVGSTLAVAVPAFVRELHASKFVEPVSGLTRLGEQATVHAAARPVNLAFPPPAPLTPSAVPRGTREADAPSIWEHPTWKALDFRAAPEGVPHAFAFAFDSTNGAQRSTFVAQAHGDLDGDGVVSTFEVRGHAATNEPAPAIEPGMYVEAEVE